jgi:TonB family protein
MILQVVFYPDDALDLSRAIRVDMVDLPDKIETYQMPEEKPVEVEKKPEPPAPEETPEPVVEEKPEPKAEPKAEPKPEPKEKPKPKDDSVNINKIKSKQKEALNKLKTASAIDKLKKEMTEPKNQPAQPKKVFKGRILSAGTSLTGLDKLQSDSYLSQLDAKIKAHWSLPQWLIGKTLRARLQIKLDEDGNIIFRKITQSSGNTTYDDYCLAAIDKATSLPKVPDKFINVYKIDGITIGFPD